MTKRKERTCGCGHDASWHLVNKRDPKAKRGACTYGQREAEAQQVALRCTCTHFHSRGAGGNHYADATQTDVPVEQVRDAPHNPRKPELGYIQDPVDRALARVEHALVGMNETLKDLARAIRGAARVRAASAAAKAHGFPPIELPPFPDLKLPALPLFAPDSTMHNAVTAKDWADAVNGKPATGEMGKGEMRVLDSIIKQGDAGSTLELIALDTGYKATSRKTYLGKLRERGFIARNGDVHVATKDGRYARPETKPLPESGPALRDHWLGNLPAGELKVFKELIGAWPHGLEDAELEARTEYKPTSRKTYVGHLRARRLITRQGTVTRLAARVATGTSERRAS